MKTFTFFWNPNLDKTRITFTNEFNDSSWIVRADVLKDAMGIIEEKYMKVLNEYERENNEQNA